jgi:hypothetical protein
VSDRNKFAAKGRLVKEAHTIDRGHWMQGT